jgi:uncharacterized protein DUF6011
MTINARFESTCPLCGNRIAIGDQVNWERGQKATHLQCPPRRIHSAPSAPALEVEDQGVYVLPDGRIVKIQANRDKTRVYPKLWREISGQRLTEADTRVRGEYLYSDDYQARRDLLAEVQASGHRMTLDEAKAFILRYGICARCGRGLKDATSVERGLGPVCKRYFEGASGAELLAQQADTVAQPPATEPTEPTESPLIRAVKDARAAAHAAAPDDWAAWDAAVEAYVQARRALLAAGSPPPADDDEEDPTPLPRTPYHRRSRWSRPGDDELEHAAF